MRLAGLPLKLAELGQASGPFGSKEEAAFEVGGCCAVGLSPSIGSSCVREWVGAGTCRCVRACVGAYVHARACVRIQ